MEQWTISRQYTFAAAHRLEGHPKCGRLHGHNYDVVVELTSNELTLGSWVMDYAQLDAVVKPIVEELDHRYIVSHENLKLLDPYASLAMDRGDAVTMSVDRSTVECMSKWFADEVTAALKFTGADWFLDVAITMRESPKSTCTYSKAG
jgi:queuosine biosynthesis protein QueD